MIGYTCLRLRSPPGPEKLLKARRGMWPDEAGQTPGIRRLLTHSHSPFWGRDCLPRGF